MRCIILINTERDIMSYNIAITYSTCSVHLCSCRVYNSIGGRRQRRRSAVAFVVVVVVVYRV